MENIQGWNGKEKEGARKTGVCKGGWSGPLKRKGTRKTEGGKLNGEDEGI